MDKEKQKKLSKERFKRFREKNPDYHREYYQKNKKEINEKAKLYKKKREIIKNRSLYNKRYREKNKEIINKKAKEYSKMYKKLPENKIKLKSQIIAQKIPIPKEQLCEICKINEAKDRHHPDYNKSLNILYLCKSCHKRLHNEEL